MALCCWADRQVLSREDVGESAHFMAARMQNETMRLEPGHSPQRHWPSHLHPPVRLHFTVPTFFTQSVKLWNQQLIRPDSNCFAMAPPLHLAHCTGEYFSHTWVFEDAIYLTETNGIYIVYVSVYFNRLFSLFFFKKINLNKPVLSIHSALMATWHHKYHLSCSERKVLLSDILQNW